MPADDATVLKAARLARIAVEPAEVPRLRGELDAILGFVESLAAVDVEGVPPMTSVTPMALPLREDVVTGGGIPEAVLANAPDARDGFFVVPKVVE